MDISVTSSYESHHAAQHFGVQGIAAIAGGAIIVASIARLLGFEGLISEIIAALIGAAVGYGLPRKDRGA